MQLLRSFLLNDDVADLAVRKIQEHDQSFPLFLYIAFQSVHDPFVDIVDGRLVPG